MSVFFVPGLGVSSCLLKVNKERNKANKQNTWSEPNGDCTVTEGVCAKRTAYQFCSVPSISGIFGNLEVHRPAKGRKTENQKA